MGFFSLRTRDAEHVLAENTMRVARGGGKLAGFTDEWPGTKETWKLSLSHKGGRS